MIMTIAAFNKDSNVIFFENNEKLDGWKGIDLITATRPVVIIDEPQSVDNTTKAQNAIKALNPLAILRYSATHKEPYNLVYRLSPVDAYQKHLVKEIYVDEVSADEDSTKAYVKLMGITSDGENVSSNRARVEIFVKNKKDGSVEKKTVTVKTNDDLFNESYNIAVFSFLPTFLGILF